MVEGPLGGRRLAEPAAVVGDDVGAALVQEPARVQPRAAVGDAGVEEDDLRAGALESAKQLASEASARFGSNAPLWHIERVEFLRRAQPSGYAVDP